MPHPAECSQCPSYSPEFNECDLDGAAHYDAMHDLLGHYGAEPETIPDCLLTIGRAVAGAPCADLTRIPPWFNLEAAREDLARIRAEKKHAPGPRVRFFP